MRGIRGKCHERERERHAELTSLIIPQGRRWRERENRERRERREKRERERDDTKRESPAATIPSHINIQTETEAIQLEKFNCKKPTGERDRG